MSFLTRPSVVFAIVFCCFAVLIPRVFLPLFRSKPAVPAHNYDEHFNRPPPPMTHTEHVDTVQHIPGSPPHMRGAHPSMRMHHPGANSRQQPAAVESTNSKSIVTLALPMYTVGIGVFFIYTCCKYWSKKNTDETKPKKRLLNENNLLWNNEEKKVKYDILDKDSEEEEETKENFYAGLDADYVEYLKSKKQKALDAERAMTDEQKQMHYALEEMKKSLSFISSKLVTKESRGNLHGEEVVQLQERLASTEAQMCKILTALDTASDKVKELSKKPEKIKEEKEEEEEHQSIPKLSNEQDSSSSLSDEEDEDNPSESTSSSNSSAEEDQSAPTDEQNRLTKRNINK